MLNKENDIIPFGLQMPLLGKSLKRESSETVWPFRSYFGKRQSQFVKSRRKIEKERLNDKNGRNKMKNNWLIKVMGIEKKEGIKME